MRFNQLAHIIIVGLGFLVFIFIIAIVIRVLVADIAECVHHLPVGGRRQYAAIDVGSHRAPYHCYTIALYGFTNKFHPVVLIWPDNIVAYGVMIGVVFIKHAIQHNSIQNPTIPSLATFYSRGNVETFCHT